MRAQLGRGPTSTPPGPLYQNGVITIDGNSTRPDWNAIRAEYISGVSSRKLAEKYGVSRTCVLRKCKTEEWTKSRNEARAKATEKAIQKTAEAAATNAAKLEKARGLALDLTLRILEQYPTDGGSKHRVIDQGVTYETMTEFELFSLVSVLEKLGKNGSVETTDDPLMKMLEAWNNASAGK